MIDMRSQATPDQRLAEIARAQYGVISRAQLYEMGFDNPALERRIAAGRLHRLHRGVYAVGHTVLGRHGWYLAAVLATGGVLSHRSAAALWGLRPTDAARVDVAVSHTSGFRTNERIVVHRSRRPIDATTHEVSVQTARQTRS